MRVLSVSQLDYAAGSFLKVLIKYTYTTVKLKLKNLRIDVERVATDLRFSLFAVS